VHRGAAIGRPADLRTCGLRTVYYLEVTSEQSVDTFGLTTETVSGQVAAPTLDVASQVYAAVRSGASYATALVLNERRPTVSRYRIQDTPGHEVTGLDERYAFSFQVLRPRGTTSLEYELGVESSLQTLEKRSTVREIVRAAPEAVAQSYLDSFVGGMELGKKLTTQRLAEYRRVPKPGTGTAEVFLGLRFTEVWLDLLTGVSGILECEVAEEVRHSGARLVARPIPDGPSVVQNCGTAHGSRTVTAQCVATAETAGRNWVRAKREELLEGDYEEPPRVGTVFRWLPQTDGVVRGVEANVKLFEITGQYTEVLPDYGR
jgi:hypothetical protein